MSAPSGRLHYSQGNGLATLCGRTIFGDRPRLTGDPARADCLRCRAALRKRGQL